MSDDPRSSEFTTVLLAGGTGSRLGGPKADLLVDGEPILLRARRSLKDRVVLSLRQGQTCPHAELFDDIIYDDASGPTPAELAGAIVARVSGMGLLVPIDMPCIAGVLHELRAAIVKEPAALVAMFARGGAIEPLPFAFRSDLAEVLQRRIASGDHSLRGLAAEPYARVVEAEHEPQVWTHLNSPEDVLRSGLRIDRRASGEAG